MNEKIIADVQKKFPWLSKAQAWEFQANELFGFDARMFPVFSQETGLVAINTKGGKVAPVPTVTRASVEEAKVKLIAVVQIEFDVVLEQGRYDELIGKLRTSPDLRNSIARRVEGVLRLGGEFSERGVGWMDADREILIAEHADSVKVRGIAKAKDVQASPRTEPR